jgi:hypothetical protein
MIIFTFIIVMVISGNIFSFLSLGLTWDIDYTTGNPIDNIISLMDIRSDLIQANNQQNDLK